MNIKQLNEKLDKVLFKEENSPFILPKEIIEFARMMLSYPAKELKRLFSEESICNDADAFEMYKKCNMDGYDYLLSKVDGRDYIFVQLENPADVYTEWDVYKDGIKLIGI